MVRLRHPGRLCALYIAEFPTCNRPSEQVFVGAVLRNVEVNPRPGQCSRDSPVWHSERMRADSAPSGPGCTVSVCRAVLSRNVLGETGEYHETPQSGQLVSRQRFEPNTSRMRDWSDTAALTCLIKFCNVRSWNEVRVVIFFRCVSTRLPLSVSAFFIYPYLLLGVCFCYFL
jgi:hypothetical protein